MERQNSVWCQLYGILEKSNLWRQNKDQWLPGVGREKNKGAEHRIFRTMKLFYMIIQWWIQVIVHVSKSINYRTQRVDPKVNNGLWVIKKSQCRFMDCKKYAIRWNILIERPCMCSAKRYTDILSTLDSILLWNWKCSEKYC